MIFEQSDGFGKDMKRLKKKYRSLQDDLQELCKVLAARRPVPRKEHTARLAQSEEVSIWKMRLFCEYLKNKSLRVVLAYHEDGSRVEFLEMYAKGDKANQDVLRYRRVIEAGDLIQRRFLS